jgi:hypothetical protein
MSPLGQFLLPVGSFIALVGVVLFTNSPFMREILGHMEYLQKNRRVVGAVLVIIGLVLMLLSFSV